ncbi:MAG: hypothetical protein QXH51_00810 [Candidatus Bathyarchaeia archaeon]
MGELKDESKRYKSRLNTLKEEIKELNETLYDLEKEKGEKISSLKKLRERIKERLRAGSGLQRGEKKLETEISNLEWTIQTTPLSLTEEKRIIAKIKSLEEQLYFYRELNSMRDEVQTIKKNIEEIKEKINSCVNAIAEKISERQKLRGGLAKILGEINEIKLELEKINREYYDKRDRVSELRSKHKDLISQIIAIKKGIKEEKEKRKIDRESALKEKIKKEVLEKIESGKKVSFEEFKVFLEEGDANNI